METVTTSPLPPRRAATATNIILVLNLVVYFAIETQGGATYDNLIRFGAKENGLIAAGQWYRLLSPIFLHAGLMHLGFNMYALFQVGRYLESMIGTRSYLLFYLLGGITSTLCSFALSDAMSVGASGCLYAVLLGLFVLQRYEEQLARELGMVAPKSPLGTLIVLNGMITFVIPNIDWAAHLGGALAGTLMGYAIIMRHKWQMRMNRCKRYLDPCSALPHRPLWERPQFYLALLGLMNLGFSFRYFYVTELDKEFGLGVLQASESTLPPREPSEIEQFGKLITSEKSETHPLMLTQLAADLHSRGFFLPAFLVYHSVLLIVENDRTALDPFQHAALNGLTEQAYHANAPQEVLMAALGERRIPQRASVSEIAERLASAANLLTTLRFYKISAKLNEAAYLMESNSSKRAIAAFASLKELDDFGELTRFRDIAESLMAPEDDPLFAQDGSAPSAGTSASGMKHKEQRGNKSLGSFVPAAMWTVKTSTRGGRPGPTTPSGPGQPGPTTDPLILTDPI